MGTDKQMNNFPTPAVMDAASHSPQSPEHKAGQQATHMAAQQAAQKTGQQAGHMADQQAAQNADPTQGPCAKAHGAPDAAQSAGSSAGPDASQPTDRGKVITPEIVHDSEQGYDSHTGYENHPGHASRAGRAGRAQQGESFHRFTSPNGGTHVVFNSWQAGGANPSGLLVGRDGCLPALLTLVLTAACAVQFGLLSAIGFAFFYALCSAVGFFVRVRSLLEGRSLSPWFFRAASWLAAYALVVWLS